MPNGFPPMPVRTATTGRRGWGQSPVILKESSFHPTRPGPSQPPHPVLLLPFSISPFTSTSISSLTLFIRRYSPEIAIIFSLRIASFTYCRAGISVTTCIVAQSRRCLDRRVICSSEAPWLPLHQPPYYSRPGNYKAAVVLITIELGLTPYN